MDIVGKTIWQVAAGDTNRNFVDLCLKWDVILNGPGSAGPWPDCIESLRKELKLSEKKIDDLRRFCEVIKDGDIVLLRLGTADIFGVGLVVGQYEWKDEFSDVDGWDLQHVRRVRWLWKYEKNSKKFDPYTLKFGDTAQTIDSDEIKKWISQIVVDDEALNKPLAQIPIYESDS